MSVTELRLPELGEGVSEGELIKWLVKPGDSVRPDQAVAELMTDKATVEVPATAAGVVKDLKFKAGETVKVDSVLLTLEGGTITSATKTTSPAPATKSPAPAPTAAGGNGQPTQAAPTSGTGRKDVKLPELGEGVAEGELISWKVKVGDLIKPDQTVAEIMTDKATVEVPSNFAGKVLELKFKVGDQVKVENTLLILETNAAQNQMPSTQTSGASQIRPAAALAAASTSVTAAPATSRRLRGRPRVADWKTTPPPQISKCSQLQPHDGWPEK